MFLKTATLTLARVLAHRRPTPRTLAALKLSFGAAFAAAIFNLVIGTLVAWVLVRYDFPFKRVLDATVDLPFALPTAVAGIALAAIYAPNGWIGQFLDAARHQGRVHAAGRGHRADLHRPAVRRAHGAAGDAGSQPDVEEAAATLGATRVQTLTSVVLPSLAPAMLTGLRSRSREP